MLNLLGPSELGGRSDSLERDAPALAKSKNISIHEAKLEVSFKLIYIYLYGLRLTRKYLIQLVNSPTEKVTKIAGLPAAYHYEFESEHGIVSHVLFAVARNRRFTFCKARRSRVLDQPYGTAIEVSMCQLEQASSSALKFQV